MTTAVPLDPDPSVDLTPAGQIAKLRHGDPGERYYAAWWLGRMRIAEGIPALIEALADETDRTAQGDIRCGATLLVLWVNWDPSPGSRP